MSARLAMTIALLCTSACNAPRQDTTLADPPPDVALEKSSFAPAPPSLDPPAEYQAAKDKPVVDVASLQGGTGSDAQLSVMVVGEAECEVWLGGKLLGISPFVGTHVPSGRHRVEVRCPSGKGYRTEITMKGHEKLIIKQEMLD